MGPLALEPGKLGYLIFVIDYLTKWIEAKALATITITNVIKFFKKNVLAKF